MKGTKFYISKDGEFKTIVPKTRYQTKTSVSAQVLQSPPILLDNTLVPSPAKN